MERVEVKDVRLPVQMQRAMATEAEATREARAKVIAAEGEQKASVALRDAADIINQSPIALQLRYLQTLTNISAEKVSSPHLPLFISLIFVFTYNTYAFLLLKNSTIVFPVPIEMLRHFGSKWLN